MEKVISRVSLIVATVSAIILKILGNSNLVLYAARDYDTWSYDLLHSAADYAPQIVFVMIVAISLHCLAATRD